MKKILNRDEAKQVAQEAIREISGAVKATLGPGGNPQVLQRQGNAPDGSPLKPLVTKDGVTVAEYIRFRDPAKDTFAQAILEVAQKTVNQAGDGTTTAIVLAEAIYNAGYKHIQQGKNGIRLYEDLKQVRDEIIRIIDKRTKPVETEQQITDVAKVSANGDEEIAKVVCEALTSVGEDGHVAIEEGVSRETVLQITEGTMYKQGWRAFSPYGVNLVSNEAKKSCELANPAVLLYAGKLESIDDFGAFINMLMKANDRHELTEVVPLMIVAHDYSDDVKNYILSMRVQQKLPIAAIKSPFDGSPNARTEMLQDLAVILGGKVGARGILDLKDMTDENLGCADRVEVYADETVFFRGQGSEEAVLQRVKDLKELKRNSFHEFDVENLNLRIGKLTGGIAVVQAGGDTELEILERKDRIEDALCAARVAVQEGVVPGGGYTLNSIAELMPENRNIAYSIMKEALQQPMVTIIENAGFQPEVVKSHLEPGYAFDARAEKNVRADEWEVVDPAKVTKSALENAVSIAGLLLTTGGAVVTDNTQQDGLPNPMAAMMGLG